jgi:hypothetical protein
MQYHVISSFLKLVAFKYCRQLKYRFPNWKFFTDNSKILYCILHFQSLGTWFLKAANSLRGSGNVCIRMKEKFCLWSFVLALMLTRIVSIIMVIFASFHFLIMARSCLPLCFTALRALFVVLSRTWSEHTFLHQYV